MKFKLMAVLKGNLRKQVSCIDTASQLISLAVQIACFNINNSCYSAQAS